MKNKNIFKIFTARFRHIFTALLVFGILVLIGLLPGVGFLRYYIDGYSIQRRDIFARPGVILWEKPTPLPCKINEKPDNLDAAISSDGKTLVFTHKYSKNNSELYICYFINGKWTKSMPIKSINSPYNEINPFLSYDDKYLFFSSDRPGGKGGYDIWCSVNKNGKWSLPYLLGGDINSKYDEKFPSLSPNSQHLFFSSDRAVPNNKQKQPDTNRKVHSFDLYIAKLFIPEDDNKKYRPPNAIDIPAFTDTKNIKELNTPYNEGRLVITGRGDIAYFSSDRPGGLGGFDIYKTHYFNNSFYTPENLGYPVNTVYDEISPTITMEGFKIFFSSNRFARAKADFTFYATSARQVVAKIDYTALIAILVILLSLLATSYILHILLTNVDMKTITKCLLLSVLLHLLFLLISSGWYIGEKISQAMQNGPENMTININNLARENIAVAIKEGIAALPKVTEPITVTRPPDMPTPVSKTQINKNIQPIVKQTITASSALSPISEMVPDNFDSPSQMKSDIGKLLSVKPSLLGHSNIRMEVPAGKSSKATGSSKGKSKGLPAPPSPITPVKQIDVVSIQTTNPTNKIYSSTPKPIAKITATTLRNKTVAVINTPSERRGEYETPASLKQQINGKNLALSQGASSLRPDNGLLIFNILAPMETRKKEKEDYKTPEPSMLPLDKNLNRLIKMGLPSGLSNLNTLQLIYKMIQLKNFFRFPDFHTISILLDRNSNLSDISDILYKNSPQFQISPDTELEVPEDYRNNN